MDAFLAILGAVPVTLLVTFSSFVCGAVLGLFLAAGRRSRFAVVRIVAKAIIDVLRGIPPIVLLFILFFGIGANIIRWDPLPAGIVTLSLISAGQLSEIYRGGLLAVHGGQFEAAYALGLGHVSTFVDVIGPQAFRVALPSMVAWLISLLKDSAVVYTIGVAEIMFVTYQAVTSSGNTILPYLIASAVYIGLGLPLAALSRYLVSRLTPGRTV